MINKITQTEKNLKHYSLLYAHTQMIRHFLEEKKGETFFLICWNDSEAHSFG